MRLTTHLVIREDWNPQDLHIFDFGELTFEEIIEKIKPYINNAFLTIEISMWNQDRLEQLREQRAST